MLRVLRVPTWSTPAHLVQRRRVLAKDGPRKVECRLSPPQRGPPQRKHDQHHGSDPWQEAENPGGLKTATIDTTELGPVTAGSQDRWAQVL